MGIFLNRLGVVSGGGYQLDTTVTTETFMYEDYVDDYSYAYADLMETMAMVDGEVVTEAAGGFLKIITTFMRSSLGKVIALISAVVAAIVALVIAIKNRKNKPSTNNFSSSSTVPSTKQGTVDRTVKGYKNKPSTNNFSSSSTVPSTKQGAFDRTVKGDTNIQRNIAQLNAETAAINQDISIRSKIINATSKLLDDVRKKVDDVSKSINNTKADIPVVDADLLESGNECNSMINVLADLLHCIETRKSYSGYSMNNISSEFSEYVSWLQSAKENLDYLVSELVGGGPESDNIVRSKADVYIRTAENLRDARDTIVTSIPKIKDMVDDKLVDVDSAIEHFKGTTTIRLDELHDHIMSGRFGDRYEDIQLGCYNVNGALIHAKDTMSSVKETLDDHLIDMDKLDKHIESLEKYRGYRRKYDDYAPINPGDYENSLSIRDAALAIASEVKKFNQVSNCIMTATSITAACAKRAHEVSSIIDNSFKRLIINGDTYIASTRNSVISKLYGDKSIQNVLGVKQSDIDNVISEYNKLKLDSNKPYCKHVIVSAVNEINILISGLSDLGFNVRDTDKLVCRI